MKELKNVQGTMQEVKEVEFNVDTVYVRTNVVRIENENFKGWQYDEIQYTYQEWADVQHNKTVKLENAQNQQDQLALESLFKIEMLENKSI